MLTTTEAKTGDELLDATLRPRSFMEYIGQESIKNNLHILIRAAQKRRESIEHVLLCGPAGLGKTTLAHIIAKELGVNIKVTSGPAIERVGDLGAILTNLSDGDILFIDEIHRLHKTVEEILYPAMEDYKLDIVVGKGPSARTLQLDLPRFTLIGATTRLGVLTNPLRDRFGAIHRLEFYVSDEIEQILLRSSKILSVDITPDGIREIARVSRQTPRVANRLLKRVRDFAQTHDHAVIDGAIAREALSLLNIDTEGLEPVDRQILEIILKKFGGGPVGVQTIATATAEEPQTIEDVYEPYLIQIGFLSRTPRGRVITERACRHLGHELPKSLEQKPLL